MMFSKNRIFEWNYSNSKLELFEFDREQAERKGSGQRNGDTAKK